MVGSFTEKEEDERVPILKPKKKKLTYLDYIVYGLPNFSLAQFISFYGVSSTFYYTNALKVQPDPLNTAYSLQMLIVVLGFPFFGWLLDITNTRWGRRKPWIAVMSPVFFWSTTIFWWPPSGWETQWFFIWGVISYTSCFTVATPLSSLGIDITDDYHERSVVFGYGEVFFVIGWVVGTGMPTLVSSFFDSSDTERVYLGISIVSSIVGMILFTIFLIIIQEPELENKEFEEKNRVPLVSGLRFSLVYNKANQILLICITLFNASPFMIAYLPFWLQYTLELSSLWQSILMSLTVIIGFLFVPVWALVSRMFGKVRAYQLCLSIGATFLLIYCVPVYFTVDSLFTKIFVSALVSLYGLNGVILGFSNFLYQSLQGDVCDYDELLTGLRRESQYTNLMQYFNWLFSLTGAVVPLAVFNLLGFDSNNDTQSFEVREGIGYVLGPAGAMFLFGAAFSLFFYPISEKVFEKIKEGIRNHNEGREAVDPITNCVIFPHQDTSSKLKMTETPDPTPESIVFSAYQAEADFKLKWTLFHFAKWEIELAVKKGIPVLYKINSLCLAFWILCLLGGISAVVVYPYSLQFVSYWFIICISMIFYTFAQLYSVRQLQVTNVSQDKLLQFLQLLKQYS